VLDRPGEGPRSIPISALEHHAYCPRQAALIHVEGYFDTTVDTVRGDLAHAAVNRPGMGHGRDHSRLFRSLPVWSEEFGLHGVCDVVQFDPTGPLPVEHKSGSYRPGGPADVQVGAQVLCLREMFQAEVPTGVIFAGKDRRRHEIRVDDALVARVQTTTTAVRALLEQSLLPEPVRDSRCRRCSLRPGCMPEAPKHVDGLFMPRPEGEWHG
jgi:CRISPR-associated exonuclease Cas4